MSTTSIQQIKPNFTRVNLTNGVVWYSYEIPIAVMPFNNLALYITNQWYSQTTAKHKNYLDSDRLRRVSHDKFLSILATVTG